MQLPVASTDVGDVRAMLAVEARDCVVEQDDAALATVLRTLVQNQDMRLQIGAANRHAAEARFSAAQMFESYRGMVVPVEQGQVRG